MTEPTQDLDLKGLQCPLPILRTKKALKELDSGDVIRVEATDPGSVKDFDSFCNQTGNKMVEQAESDGVYTFTIRKK